MANAPSSFAHPLVLGIATLAGKQRVRFRVPSNRGWHTDKCPGNKGFVLNVMLCSSFDFFCVFRCRIFTKEYEHTNSAIMVGIIITCRHWKRSMIWVIFGICSCHSSFSFLLGPCSSLLWTHLMNFYQHLLRDLLVRALTLFRPLPKKRPTSR